jgi:predicted nucleic acid-binding protein
MIPQTSDQFDRALSRCEDRVDKDWSPTDCASFLIMEAEGIEVVLTHDDRHFAQAGFQALLR